MAEADDDDFIPASAAFKAARILDAMGEGFYALDREWRITYFNRACERHFARRREDVLGKNIWDLYPHAVSTVFYREFHRVMAEHVPTELQVESTIRADRWVEMRVYPAPDGLLVYFRDVTEQRRAADELRRSRAHLAAIVDQAVVGIIEVDLAGRITFVNDRFCELVGRAREELIGGSGHPGMSMQALTHPDDLANNLVLFERAVKLGEAFTIDKRYVRPDGSTVWVQNHVSVVRSEDGQPRGLVAVTVDISEQRRVAMALQDERSRLQVLTEAMPQLVWSQRTDGSTDYVNVRWTQYSGLDLEATNADRWDTFCHAEDMPALMAWWQRAHASGKPQEVEVRYRAADGSYRWFLSRVVPHLDEKGEVLRWIGTSTDIDDRRRAEQALVVSEGRYRRIFETVGVALFEQNYGGVKEILDQLLASGVTDLRGYLAANPDRAQQMGNLVRVVDVNQAAVEMFGASDKRELLGSLRTVFAPSSGMGLADLLVAMSEGVPLMQSETVVQTVSGERRDVLYTLRFGGADLESVLLTMIDITDRRKAEAERLHLLESERAARAEAERASHLKDEFLATLSHELRTPLNAILGWSQLLTQGRPSEQDARRGLEVIQRNARTQAQLIEDLLDMSRIISGKLRLDVQRVELGEVVEAAVESVRHAAEAKGIRLTKVLDSAVGLVSGDPARLQQVVWNLLSNAIKFTPKGGRIQVLLERVNSHVEITVSDTGAGIKPEFLPHVFDRFRQADASTTRKYGGLGLGLSIVKSLVELHGGAVQAKSPGEGRGATFMVSLPLLIVHEEGDRRRRKGDAAQPAEGAFEGIGEEVSLRGLKVLVVDDEGDARELVRRVLEEHDAVVVLAASAAEGLNLVERERPDIILSDIGMPGVDGYELLRRVRALSTEQGGRTPAIALTAFARSEDRRRALVAGFQVHVAKPVEPQELVAVVASLANVASVRRPLPG